MTWTEHDGRLSCEFHFDSFVQTLDFVCRVGNLAEQTNHHPDFHIYFTKVILELRTHDEGKVTQKDWRLAHLIEEQY